MSRWPRSLWTILRQKVGELTQPWCKTVNEYRCSFQGVWTVSDPIFHLLFLSYFTICCGNSGISPLLRDWSKNLVFASFFRGSCWSVKSHVPRKWVQVKVFLLVLFGLPTPSHPSPSEGLSPDSVCWPTPAGPLGDNLSPPSKSSACPLLGLTQVTGQAARRGSGGCSWGQGVREQVLSCRERPLWCLPAQAVWILTRQCGLPPQVRMFRAVGRAEAGAPIHAPTPQLIVSGCPSQAFGSCVTGCPG